MDPGTERRLLQAILAAACLVPLAMGAASIFLGPAVLREVGPPVAIDLDSHFRYLSGLLFGIGLSLAACIPRIERNGPIFRLLGLIVVIGGLARLSSLLVVGTPSAGHLLALLLELAVVPGLLVWQARIALKYRQPQAGAEDEG